MNSAFRLAARTGKSPRRQMQETLQFHVILVILARGARRPIFAKRLMNPCKSCISACGAHGEMSASQNAETLIIPCHSCDSGARRAPADFCKTRFMHPCDFCIFGSPRARGNLCVAKCEKSYNSLWIWLFWRAARAGPFPQKKA